MNLRSIAKFLLIAYISIFYFNQVVSFVLVVLIFSIVLLDSVIKGSFKYNNIIVFYSIYVFAAFVPVLLYPAELIFYLRVVFLGFMLYFIVYNLNSTIKNSFIILNIIFFSCILIAIIMIFQESQGVFNFSMNYILSLDRNRGFYFFGDERIGPNTASFCLAVAISIIYILVLTTKKYKFLKLSILLFLISLLLVAGGRNAWVSVFTIIVFGIFLEYFRFRKYKASNLIVLIFVLSILVSATFFVFSILQEYNVGNISERFSGLLNPEDDWNFQVRLQYWLNAQIMAFSNPLGLGFNAYFEIYDRTPHNELLGQLIGAGWVGAGIYFIMIISLFVNLVFIYRKGFDFDLRHLFYLSFFFLIIITFAMLTENISRSTMGTVYPLFWISMALVSKLKK